MSIINLNRIINQIRHEIDCFKNELRKLSVPSYPTSTYSDLFEDLHGKIKEYNIELDKIINDIDKTNPEETINKLISWIHNPLVQDTKFLDWLANAQTQKVPWSFIPCIEDLAKQIITEKKVIVHCSNNFNYGISWSNNTMNTLFSYYIIALPMLHRINVLWHVIIGHELFHPRCTEFTEPYNDTVLRNIRDEITKIHTVDTDDDETLFSEAERDRRISFITSEVHKAWYRAIDEILCDLACVEIFGPAAILAMRAFSSCSNMIELPSSNNNFYPPLQYRLDNV